MESRIPVTSAGPPASRRSRGAAIRRRSRLLAGWVVLLVLLAVWQIVGANGGPYYLPPFFTVVSSAYHLVTGPTLTSDVLGSLGRAGLGLVVGTIVGIGIGLVLGMARMLDPWVRPALEFLRAIPAPVVIPIGLVLFGLTNTSRVEIIAFACTWPILLNCMDGTRRADPLLFDAARLSGARTPGLLFKIALPASMPQTFAGIRIALSLALVMMVLSEMIGASSGLGYYILTAQRSFAFAEMWGGVLVIGLVGWLATTVLLMSERRLTHWHGRHREANNA